MQFEEIKTFADIPQWVKDNVTDGDKADQLCADVDQLFKELIDTPMGQVSTFTLSEGQYVAPSGENEKYLAKRVTVSVPHVTILTFSFVLDERQKVFNIVVDETGGRAENQSAVRALGFGEIKEIVDVAEWIASDGANPELSIDLIDQFQEAATKFLREIGRQKVEMRLGVVHEPDHPGQDRFKVIQLIRHNPYRTIMFVFTMTRDRITTLEHVGEEHFRELALGELRYLQ